MWPLIAFVAVLAFLWLLLRHQRLARLMRDLAIALEERRPYLVDRSVGSLKLHPVHRVLQQISALQEENSKVTATEAGLLNQIEVTLGNIQEAVFILDENNFIVLANQASRSLFTGGHSMNGRRLESIIRSSSLLDYIKKVKLGKPLARQEIEIKREQDRLWFEVSGTLVRPSEEAAGPLTLFVLHDISRLKHLEAVRKEFVANVSHELRTPVTIIKGYSETLLEDHAELAPEERERFLSKIRNNVERLHLLIEDLLTLSRLESSSEHASGESASLLEVAKECAETYEDRLDKATQRIVLELDEEVEKVPMDRVKLTQTLSNLIDNSLRYAMPFKEIRIRSQRLAEEEQVEISVSDDGVGIPEKDLQHIFERFYRVDKGRSRERGGTGLGLSIVKHIVQLHGGEITARSAKGQGTTVAFRLPLKHAEPTMSAAPIRASVR